MPKRKRKATAAQLRNLAKGRAKLKAMRKAGTVATRRRRPTRRNPCVPAAHRNPAGYKYSTIRLRTTNDTNGNPRRIFVVLSRGNLAGLFDEGYSGEHSIPDKQMRESYGGLTFDITPGEYRALKKMAKEGVKGNPAFGNFLTARNVLKTGRTTNPQKRRVVPSGRRVPQHYVIASIDPRPPNRIVYWGHFGWGPAGKAMIFPSATTARNIAEKKMKRTAVGAKEKTAERLLREALKK